MALIRNADDFGKSEEVNQAIRECFRKGWIDRTTLMVNMDAAEDAVRIAKEDGFAHRVGIHFNITSGMPLSQPIRSNPLLCDPEGRFHAAFRQTTKYRLYMDELSKEQIYTELSAQLKQYADWGLTLMHADSHHHVHTDYPVFCALRELAKKNRFSSVRISRNLFKKGSLPMRIYKCWYNSAVKKLCDHTSDYFGSVSDLMEYDDPDGLRALCKAKEIELMMHPLYDENGILLDSETPMEEAAARIDQLRL